MRILNFGSLNIDYVYQVDHFVQAGETVSSCGYHVHVGGKGLNQSVALARAGACVFHAGCVGSDGAFLVDYLAENKVDVGLVRTLDGPSGHAIIQVNQQGNNCILLHAGANHRVSSSMVDETLQRFGPGDMLLVQNEINCTEMILKSAKQRGLITALNPSPITSSLLRLDLACVDWLILNEVEGAALSAETDPSLVQRALELCFPNAHILLTLGAQGSVYIHRGHRIQQHAYRVNAVDTTAAGDTFTGFFLSQFAATGDIPGSMDIAAKASAIAVTRPGAAETIPTMHDVASYSF